MNNGFQIICRTDNENRSFAPFAIIAADNPMKNDIIAELNKRASDAAYGMTLFTACEPANFNGGRSLYKNTIPLVETMDELKTLIPECHESDDENFVVLLINNVCDAQRKLFIHKSNMPLLYMILTGKPYKNESVIGLDFTLKLQTFINSCFLFDDTDAKLIEILEHEYSKDLTAFLFERANYINDPKPDSKLISIR